MAPTRKKRVLLVDTSRVKRDLRSETMRKLGADVDCAADVTEARCWWRAGLYDLVLIHVEDGSTTLEKFCDDLRGATPPQQIMFLVGGPEFLASSPANGETVTPQEDAAGQGAGNDPNASGHANGADDGQRWGLLEACRKISAIRSACDARSRALRNRPEPPRDSEISRAARALDSGAIELVREELP